MTNTGSNFAAKLNRLFEEKRKPDGTRYTQTDVVEGTKGVLTRVCLWKLRKGSATNPGLHVVQALANFFGVEPSYFLEATRGKLMLPRKSKNETSSWTRSH